MPMTNVFKGASLNKWASDTWKMILMATGFTFNIDSHDTYALVSGSELANGNGYITGGLTLTSGAVAVDDVNDRADLTFDDAVWTASGGSIGPTPMAVVFDDTDATDIVAGNIDFGDDQTATDGGTFTVANPVIRLT